MIPTQQSLCSRLWLLPACRWGWIVSVFLLGWDVSSTFAGSSSFEDQVGDLIGRYCIECHSSEKQKGDLDLEVMMTPGQFARFFREWEIVVEQLEAQDMPPEKAGQPLSKERSRMINAVRREIKRLSTQQSGDPGEVLLRRLTQAEYLHSIHDLSGIPFDLRSLLPEDAVGGEGFANTGEVQFTQSSTVERYLEVAHKVASHALIGAGDIFFFRDPGDTGQELSAIERIQSIYRRHGFRSGAGEGAEPFGLGIFSNAFLALWVDQYRGKLGLNHWGIDDAATFADAPVSFVRHIARALGQSEAQEPLKDIQDAWKGLPAPSGMGLDMEKDRVMPYVDALFARVQDWQNQFAKKAKHFEESAVLDSHASANQVDAAASEFAFFFPSVSQREPAPSDRDPIPQPYDNSYNNAERNAFHYQVKYHRDDSFLVEYMLDPATVRDLDIAWADLYDSFGYHQENLNLLIEHFDLEATQIPDIAVLTPDHISRMPVSLQQWVTPLKQHHDTVKDVMSKRRDSHVEQCLQFAARAWRRDLAHEEIEQLRSFYHSMRTNLELSHKNAIRSLIGRVLISPSFLYRIESPSEQMALVSSPELATRLSYFLWASPPDAVMLEDAAAGRLQDDEILSGHVKRMLKDARVARFAEEFFGQWFGYYRFPEFNGVDEKYFTYWNASLRRSLYREANLFFTDLVRNDELIDQVVLSNDGFLNRQLAEHYQIPWGETAEEDAFIRVNQLQEHQRGGLLGFGVVHAITSAPLRTSIVKRGDWILRRVLGTPVPPPPANAGSIATEGESAKAKSMRELLQAHQKEAACVSCHARMDPLGFAMESYDVTGKLRSVYENGLPVEDFGELRDGTMVKGFGGIRTYLREHIDLFHRTFCTKLIGYALGRKEQLSDRKLIDAMMDSLSRGEPISRQIEWVILSSQFRHKRGIEPETIPQQTKYP